MSTTRYAPPPILLPLPPERPTLDDLFDDLILRAAPVDDDLFDARPGDPVEALEALYLRPDLRSALCCVCRGLGDGLQDASAPRDGLLALMREADPEQAERIAPLLIGGAVATGTLVPFLVAGVIVGYLERANETQN